MTCGEALFPKGRALDEWIFARLGRDGEKNAQCRIGFGHLVLESGLSSGY